MFPSAASLAARTVRRRSWRGARGVSGRGEDDGATLLVLIAVAVLGVLVVVLVTRNGIGLSPDSSAYIEGARRLIQGDGFTASSGRTGPITQWPPLYSVMLALGGLVGIDPLAGARVLAPLLFGVNVFVAGWLVWRHGSGGILPATAAASLVIVSADLLHIHAMAWSEPLFLLLCALGGHQLALYLTPPHSRRPLLVAAALIGLAALTRYLGVALIIAGGVAILWFAARSWSWRVRIQDALLFVAVSIAPLAFWMLRNVLLTGGAAGRDLVVTPIGLGHLMRAGRTVSAWVVPPILPGNIRILFLMVVLAVITIGIARRPDIVRQVLTAPGGRLLKTLLVFAVLYGAVLTTSMVLFDADVRFNERILSPVHFLLLVAAGLALAGTPRPRGWMYACLGAVMVLQAAHAVSWARSAEQGLGFSAPVWREATLWSVIRELPDGAPLYSNAWDAVYLYTGRPTRPLPARFNVHSLVPDERYRDTLSTFRAELARRRGFVIYFPMASWRRFMPTEAELDEALDPADLRRFPDGTLYEIREVSPPPATRP